MNKEYVVLIDGTICVTDENGKITKRDIDEKNCLDELFSKENKIEILNKKIKCLKDEVLEEEKVFLLSKYMIKLQPVIVLLMTLSSTIYGGLVYDDFILYGMYYGLKGLIYSAIPTGITFICYKVVESKSAKKIKGFEPLIKEAEKLKQKEEEELERIKNLKVAESKIVPLVNKPVSLEKQIVYEEEQIEEHLNDVYQDTISNQSKKLVLKRKKLK